MFLTPSRRSIPPLGLASRPAAASESRVKLHGIKCSLLIPGRGEPIKDGAVVIHEDKIDWVGPQSKLPVKYSAIPFAQVSYLMPGLWDCHVHYFGVGESDEGGGYAALVSSRGTCWSKNIQGLGKDAFCWVHLRARSWWIWWRDFSGSSGRVDYRTKHILFHRPD
jgi:hypothetical protein